MAECCPHSIIIEGLSVRLGDKLILDDVNAAINCGGAAFTTADGIAYQAFSGDPALDAMYAFFHTLNHNDLPKLQQLRKKFPALHQ